MRWHSLSNPDDGVAIFHPKVESEIRKLDNTQARDALTAMINCLENDVPESVIEKTYETCKELQQLRQGDLRLYVLLATYVPEYNVLWVFAVKKHRYRNLGKFDARACQKANVLRKLTATRVEDYLEENEALTVDELKALRESL
ncbi:hypothetical protein ACFQO4_19175 [Saliphagus sp. GCM10025334]